MTITYQGSNIPTAFASCSLMSDTASLDLPTKMKAIRNAGFKGMELSMPDILAYGKILSGEEPEGEDFAAIVGVAEKVKKIASEIGLEIMMLQPFSRFEGWPKGSPERQHAFDKARGWIQVMEAAGTNMLQVGSSDAEGISHSLDDLAADLAELSDICAEKGFRVAYENWCWGSRAATWASVWEIVKKADRPNLGLCLDTFQSAGHEWADPTTKSGLLESMRRERLQEEWQISLKQLAQTVPPEKIYLLQISDAHLMDPPIEAKEGDDPPRSQWSHDYRPLPGRGGYLPVGEFLQAVLKTGFRSWLSVEVFDSYQKHKTSAEAESYTNDAMASLKELLAQV